MKRALLILLVVLICDAASAKNIDLSTVPSRQTVQLTIYNAEDLTLVRETRFVTFKKGINPLQFSWANTLIDPTSVELRFLTQPDRLALLDTTFPHDKPQMLYWNVQSEISGEVIIEITYFTSGITWSADYMGITAPDESTMKLEGFVTVTNHSGEDYADAQVRLVVGTINLVEKIAKLARIPVDEVAALEGARRDRLRRKAGQALFLANGFAGERMLDERSKEAKQIIKEGLSEYFIFTIEGTETIPNQWSKRMRSLDAAQVPVRVQYRYRPRQYGDQLVRMFLLTNDRDAGLGESPLPDGVVRVFRQTGRDSLSYLAAQSIKYIPIGDKIELNLGPDPQVVFELIKQGVFRDNIWGTIGAKVRRRFDEPGVQIEDRGQVTGWDEHSIFAQQIRNYTTKPIEVEVRRAYGGDVRFRSKLAVTRHDNQTVEFQAKVPARQSVDLAYEVIQKHGTNAKQTRVELEQGEPAQAKWRKAV